MVDPTKKQPGQMDRDQLQDKPSFFTIIREGHNTNRMVIYNIVLYFCLYFSPIIN